MSDPLSPDAGIGGCFEGPDAWLRGGMEVGADRSYAKPQALLAAAPLGGTTEGAEA